MSNTGFKSFTSDGGGADLGDLLVRRDIFSEGGLWLCGSNSQGELGDNTTSNRSSPVQTVAGGTTWKQAACGNSFTAAIKTDGTLWLWGINTSGQLGDYTVAIKSSPVQTSTSGTNWKQVSCGDAHSAAIKSDGTLWSWGYNRYGEIGAGTNDPNRHESAPVQTIAGGTNWKQVSCGSHHTAAIKTDGTLWAWGVDTYGQLGDNTRVHKSSPIQTVAMGVDWKQVSASGNATAAIKTDGTLWVWGRNNVGQLGDNTTTNRSSPIQTIAGGTNWKYVSIGSAAIKTDGTLWIWGGIGGDNTTTNRSSPVQTVCGGTNWKLVNYGSTAAAIKTDGTLWVWGYNYYGQLGDSTRTDRSSPIQTLIGGSNWKKVESGNVIAAIKDDIS